MNTISIELADIKKYAAEFFATFCLTLFVSISIHPSITAIIAAMTVGLFVYTIGSISGAHINPAVTLGLLSIQKKIKKQDVWRAGGYIIAQILGAIIAMICAQQIFGSLHANIENSWSVFVGEALGACILVFGVSCVGYKRSPEAASGIVVGLSLFIGLFIAISLRTNAILNPAVAIGTHSMSLLYIFSPIVGGVAGAWISRFIHE